VDWLTELSDEKFDKADEVIDGADLVVCLGSSLRIRPAGLMPSRVLKKTSARGNRRGSLVIVNLQKTDLDSRATLKINHYCDKVGISSKP
jgi:NAD-dependent SIR2 family protein deacetylase